MRVIFFILFIFLLHSTWAQQTILLNKGWEFRQAGTNRWYKAEIPGTVHTDLLSHQLIPDPFYRDNESRVQWVENETWEYRTTFDVPADLFNQNHIEIQFDGLDTYADVYLNGKKIISANNMFRQWTVDIKSLVKTRSNRLSIVFAPSALIAKKTKASDNILRPDNERVYVRKAQYQFGWDWGPRLVTCGIWKDVRLTSITQPSKESAVTNVQLITKKDSIGEAFYFTVNGKPTFIKGANWIPCENFIPRAKKLNLYEQLIRSAKEANINMLRVWGGGIYEDDIFYELCDKYGIMVWQDFMFAGALYPADSSSLSNIKAEVSYQVKRLRNHPCIVLWCGNNEIEEAWFNWGWQQQFNYSSNDSLQLWNDYKKIFHQLIPSVLNELDPQRPYWPSSPSLGWGRDSAYKKGDVHYWGVWWGKEPVEKYNEKVGRFNSEYGMQGMPDMKTIKQFALPEDMDTSSAVMRTHQKHPFGWENIRYYIEQKFRTPKSFENMVYVSQLMQADAIKTAIEAHRRNKPYNMGTLFWQWNDCWPVTSWSAVDYYGRKKALYYEVKRSFLPVVALLTRKDTVVKILYEDQPSRKITVEEKYLDLTTGSSTTGSYNVSINSDTTIPFLLKRFTQNDTGNYCVRIKLTSRDTLLSSNFFFSKPPKYIDQPAKIVYTLSAGKINLSTNKFAYGVYIDVPDGIELEDNYFHMMPGEVTTIRFKSKIPLEQLKKKIKIKSLADTY